jgi:hypothetical protein
VIDPVALQMVLSVLTGWLDRREREAIAYLIEENRLLRRQLGSRRLRLTDDDRRQLAGRAHWGAIAGADFFTTVWTWRGLVTYYTVFAIDVASRRVQVLGFTPHPEALFMEHVVRTLTMAEGGGVDAPRVSICDRDRKWSGDVSIPGRGDPRRPHSRARAQCERVRRTVRYDRSKKNAPRRTESPGTRQAADFGPASDHDDESRPTPSAARRVTQFL